MATNQPNTDEEVDLGSLFVIIGKGFSKIFNFIGSIFKGIFHFIISLLLFLKEHRLKISIATIIGFILGAFIEIKSPTTYSSELLLQTNFKSSTQLYADIQYYNDLVKQKDTARIQKTFGLDQDEAVSLKEFVIEPLRNENDIISGYNDLILAVDTLTIRSYDFQKFKTSFTDLDYNLHKVTVVSEKNDVFEGLDQVIISSVVENAYFRNLKILTNENLNRTDSIYRQNLAQVDSLRSVYMQVMLAEAKKESNGTNIDLGGSKSTTKEIELFESSKEINEELGKTLNEKSEKYEVINVISNFQPIGNKIEGIRENKAFQFAFLGALLMIGVLVFHKLNRYLENYKK
ncbi:hypothetical protein [Polaribacter sp. HL-MS24]|uniref:hypothetical protein n=1 Tax=Polaribacter sp. HL-MS24 TaxID=3077735 RepID=UPI0029342DF4|nr:hypothetical protein [Polaribacter sp. HL-MS24]WOC39237.1 hypothetical protein RRF69_05945 [Polaribacter sp. HL-MS24]